jgi:hypothetical protein
LRQLIGVKVLVEFGEILDVGATAGVVLDGVVDYERTDGALMRFGPRKL